MFIFKPLKNREDRFIPVQSSEYTDTGSLLVRVFFTRRGSPVEGATVTVFKEIEPYNVTHTLKTDSTGKTEIISLPAPPKEYSFDPECKSLPYFTYSVQVDFQGFYTNVFKSVQIYPDILTIQYSYMMPLPENLEGVNTMRVHVIPPAPCKPE